MKRVFLAAPVNVNTGFISYYREIKTVMPPNSVNWIDPANMHITLRFFGDTDDNNILRIIMGVSHVVERADSFNIRLTSLGVYRNIKRPQVLWMGCSEPSKLVGIKKHIDRELAGEGFDPEKGRYTPHLTLGRVRQGNEIHDLAGIIKQYKNTVFMDHHFGELILFESRLKPSGPDYIPLHRFSLNLFKSPSS